MALSDKARTHYKSILDSIQDPAEKEEVLEGIKYAHSDGRTSIIGYKDDLRKLGQTSLGRTAPQPTQEPVKERGFIGDVTSNLARSAKDFAELSGHALKTMDPDGGIDVVDRMGQGLINLSKKADSMEIMQEDASERKGEGLLSRGWKGGVRSAVPSLAPLAAGAGTGALAGSVFGPVGTVIGGVVGGTAATLGLFGLGTYGQKKEEYESQGIDPDSAHKAALKQAVIEGGIEEISNIAGLLTFGGGKLAAQPLKQTAKELLKTPASTFAKKLTKNMVLNEIPTEVMQSALGAKIDQDLGLLPEGAWQEAAVESIVPAMTMSVLFGVSAQGLTSMQRKQALDQLNSENPEHRFQAAQFVSKRIDDKELQQAWDNYSLPLIQEGQPIEINANFTDIAEHSGDIDGQPRGQGRKEEKPKQREISDAERMMMGPEDLGKTPEELLMGDGAPRSVSDLSNVEPGSEPEPQGPPNQDTVSDMSGPQGSEPEEVFSDVEEQADGKEKFVPGDVLSWQGPGGELVEGTVQSVRGGRPCHSRQRRQKVYAQD